MKAENFEQDRHYDDLEGNVRTFTVTDYSKKTNVYQVEEIDHDQILADVRQDLIKEILSLHPQTAIPEYESYIIRGKDVSRLEWDETALYDKGIALEQLIMQKNVMSKRMKAYSQTY